MSKRTWLHRGALALGVLAGIAASAVLIATLVQTLDKGPRAPARGGADPESSARVRLLPDLVAAGIEYPPREVALLAFLDRRSAELLARGESGEWRVIRRYRLDAHSNETSRALAERFGIYAIDGVTGRGKSIAAALDVRHATSHQLLEIRTDGGSVGGLGLPVAAAQELLALALVEPRVPIEVIVAPSDLRERSVDGVPEGLARLAVALARFPLPEPPQPLAAKPPKLKMVRATPVEAIRTDEGRPVARPIIASGEGANPLTLEGL
jgi:hypothetical protein